MAVSQEWEVIFEHDIQHAEDAWEGRAYIQGNLKQQRHKIVYGKGRGGGARGNKVCLFGLESLW